MKASTSAHGLDDERRDAAGDQGAVTPSSENDQPDKDHKEIASSTPSRAEHDIPRYPSSSSRTSLRPSSSFARGDSSSSTKPPPPPSSQSSATDVASIPDDKSTTNQNTQNSQIDEHMSPRALSVMGGRRGSTQGHRRTSSDLFDDLGQDEVDMAARGSPTRRRSAGKLVTFIDKLKPSRHSSGGGGAGSHAVGNGANATSDGEGPHSHEAKSGKSSKLASGKHTPSKDTARGDYGNFLKAAELQEKLEKEQEKAAQRELKLAKQKRGKPSTLMSSRAPLTTRPSELSNGSAEDAPPILPLEDSKRFPGGFEEEPRRHHPHRHRSHQGNAGEPSGTKSPFSSKTTPDGVGGYDVEDGEDGVKSMASSLRRSSSASSFSSTGSYGEDTIGEFTTDPSSSRPFNKTKNASTMSLKSWESSGSAGGASFASGGANPKLQGPLLELEELELRSFLKNFNRHTREVRVPASLHFPRRRMPQWEDFKIPPGEKELAARQGKRVTVLTHVDRGLQALANEEGQGAPIPRSGSCGFGSSDSHKKDKKAAKHSGANASKDSGNSLAATSAATTSAQPASGTTPKSRVTWHPDAGFIPESLYSQLDEGGPGGEDLSRIGRSFGTKTDPHEKDERKAKQLDAQRVRQRGEGLQSISSENVHDSQTELRPSRDEVGLTEGTWELINADAEHEAELDPTEGDRVDGVAFCIAYILALVERYAPDELDNTPDQTYREGRARSHLERLYIIAPFWERLLFGLRRLYRWDNPRRTSTAAMIYFVLWWTDLLPTAFFLTLIYYILQFRFFPPDVSYLHEQVRNRMARGVEADKLAERLRRRSRLDVLEIYKRFTSKYGVAVQLAAGDIADFHEKVKNLILWRNPPATWRTLTLFGVATVIVTFAPAYYIWKFVLFFIGFTFFCLLPLQSHYPRYRRPLSPFWWALWSVPSDRQFAIQILRRRHLERAQADMAANGNKKGLNRSNSSNHANNQHASGSKKSPKKRSEAAHAVKGGAMKPMTGEDQKLFGLEEEVEMGSDGEKRFKPKKLGSFFCQHHGVPGHLTVSTREVYFRSLGGSKSCKTPLEQIAGLAKTKSLQLFVWSSSGLQIARVNKRSLFFSNMVKRDEAFNLILAVGSEVWTNG